ncbi:hypothetical protein MPLB_1080124 [Mesorhizobium sp. ORS 3324]|nr:hypothetical protein MPLB_1080124 [Mesorhizobium sp. ORS 3324]
MDEQDPKEDLIEPVFRNGTVTIVGILLAFSLGFITHWRPTRSHGRPII